MSRMYALGLLVSSSASSGVRKVLCSSQYACARVLLSHTCCAALTSPSFFWHCPYSVSLSGK